LIFTSKIQHQINLIHRKKIPIQFFPPSKSNINVLFFHPTIKFFFLLRQLLNFTWINATCHRKPLLGKIYRFCNDDNKRVAAVVWNKVSVPKFSRLHYSLLMMSIGPFYFTACTAIPVNMGGSMTHSWSNLRVVYSRSGRSVAVRCNWRSLLENDKWIAFCKTKRG